MLLLKKLSRFYMDRKIGTKQLIAYLIVVLIPVLGYSCYSYLQISGNIKNVYAVNNQQILGQSYSNFRGELSHLESVSQMFQYNTTVTNFLCGYYTAESEEMYAFLSDIKPLFGYGKGSNKNIQNITLYTNKKTLLDYGPFIRNSSALQSISAEIASINPEKGLWLLDTRKDLSTLQYYQKLYDRGFYKQCGYLELTLNSGSLLENFNVFGSRQILLFRKGGEWFELKNGQLRKVDRAGGSDAARDFLDSPLSKAGSGSASDHNTLVNSISLSELGLDVMVVTPFSSILGTGIEYMPLLYLAFLLIVLSLVYYATIASLTSRIRKIAWHIGKTGQGNLLAFEGNYYQDEIGTLVKAYNGMIHRIGSLINDLNITEHKKAESDFYALQAQIKPHFLYNSLETIRMMAEANDDPAVADTLCSLGRFMRYSLSGNKNEVFLREEIENVRNYLQIYKMSMGDRLDYAICVECGIDRIKCPVFILQPLVENSLHHGFSVRRGKCLVEIHVGNRGENLEMSVSDNGEGISAERLGTIKSVLIGDTEPAALYSVGWQDGNGVGIVNVNERIRHYFGEKSGLSVESEPNERTTFTITFRRGKEGNGHEGYGGGR